MQFDQTNRVGFILASVPALLMTKLLLEIWAQPHGLISAIQTCFSTSCCRTLACPISSHYTALLPSTVITTLLWAISSYSSSEVNVTSLWAFPWSPCPTTLSSCQVLLYWQGSLECSNGQAYLPLSNERFGPDQLNPELHKYCFCLLL